MMNKLFTIGYSNHSIETFISILKKYGINVIVDVRSTPFSSFKPEFNKDTLNIDLKKGGIKYLFLGNECGARFDEPSCYRNGKADYKLIAQHKKFQNGLKRINDGSENFTIALMCAEKDPINCHRMILICRNLKNFGLPIYHILDLDNIESQKEAESRLLRLFKLNQLDMFESENDQLEKAYNMQGEKIAYKTEDYQTTNEQGNIIDG